MPTLEVTTGGQTQRVNLYKTLTVGRQPGCDVVLQDTQASRKHCQFQIREGLVVLKDLGSHNGTYIGPNKVAEAILAFGDTVRIGQSTLRLIPDEVEAGTGNESLPSAVVV